MRAYQRSALARIENFARKPAAQKWLTVRVFFKRALSCSPFLPTPMYLWTQQGPQVRFWWSFVYPDFDETRPFLAYPGEDVEELWFTYRYLSPGMCFFDVGAHHGLYSVVAGCKVGASTTVVAFEPSRRERLRARIHFLLNDTNIRLEPYAVSSTSGTGELYVVLRRLPSMNSLRLPTVEVPTKTVQVETITLDGYCRLRGITTVDLIKLDVEGGELDVFRGAAEVLGVFRPLMICEAIDWVTRPWGYPAVEIIRFLQKWDYRWFDFAEGGLLSPHAERSEYSEIRNYLAVPAEKLGQIRAMLNCVPH